ncbi:hypothetical protein H0H92_005161 [Tricholoma furcatifolium]|nr:hypothetical protein H0H92_005161 [Tricholoma furcatifolium]
MVRAQFYVPRMCVEILKIVSKDFLAQIGDPTATGTGGESVWSYVAPKSSSSSPVSRYFEPEMRPKLKHIHRGTVSMAVAPALEGHKGGCGSQFFITLGDNIDYLDGKHAVFGHVVEGLDTLDKMNDVFTDQDGRPFKDIRIRHVVVLDDPFPDPLGLIQPPSSPTRPPDNSTRIAEDEDPLATLPEEEEEKIRREKAAAASALTLEMVGDLPFANVRPPENVLFVCKLNPVTRDEDLELIFSRFGTIMSCQVIRDKRTGDSLQYAFIEFDKREDAEQVKSLHYVSSIFADNLLEAYFKMQNVLVDDRRIWVDFSQSVAKLNTHWSNDISRGPKMMKSHHAGFGGRQDLEKTRRYREEDTRHHGHEYGMVFDVGDSHGHGRKRSRSGDSLVPSTTFRALPITFDCTIYFPLFGLDPSFHLAMGAQVFSADFYDPDVALQSCEQEEPSRFHVHRSILAAASPFFYDMFMLPQDPSVSHELPIITVSETRDVLDALLKFVYPVEDPVIHSLDDLLPILTAASKYDFMGVLETLKKLLVSPEFAKADPTRVYAIASRFDLEDEARIASKYTLSTHVLDAPLSEDLKYITAYSYHRLLNLHRRRVDAATALMKFSPDITCMQCNGSSFSVYAVPKWWYHFEKAAKEELMVRPTSERIFEMEFLAQAAIAAGCSHCARSILDSWKFLQDLKKRIDDLPATI